MTDDAGCPRCLSTTIAVQFVNDLDGAQVRHCAACSFTWRTTEPREVIDAACRPVDFQLDPARVAALPDQLPRDDTAR